MRFISRLVVFVSVVLSFGCAESSFELSNSSRLPKWFQIPPGFSRGEIGVKMSYYIFPSRHAIFILHDLKGHNLAKVRGNLKGDSPIELKTPRPGFSAGYPSYEIVTINGITEVIEHRKMEPIFYITEDGAV